MPLLRSATRPQAVECFFCLSPSVLPAQLPQPSSLSDRKGKGKARAEVGTKWNWHCGRCGCWNVRDERGEMLSDHPAMHDPAFNTRSFSLRATPSTSHLPSTSSSSARTFCHSCLTNQTLIMNMLAGYLPDDNDPSYPELHASLPSYLASLHSRYPPVCPICQPAVDDALRKADQKAQVEAWGSALRRGRDTGSRAGGKGSAPGKFEVLVWRIRGVGFWAQATAYGLSGACPISTYGSLRFYAWPETWPARASLVFDTMREHMRGRAKGRETWIRNMLLVFVMRIVGAILVSYPRLRPPAPLSRITGTLLVLEAIALVHAFAAIRSPYPIALRLVRPTQLSVPSSPTYQQPSGPGVYNPYLHSSPPDHSSRLQRDLAPKHHPVFGKTSLSPRPSLSRLRDDEMDWEGPAPSALYNGGYTSGGPVYSEQQAEEMTEGYERGQGWDNFAVGKQRFFGRREGEDETGLEGLLAGWGLAEQIEYVAGSPDPSFHQFPFMPHVDDTLVLPT
ncbi:Ima1 N-terminal domain-containing protein [Dioszegia hungarica]|uniref:Ima1 N-terminal domain-containing protein n=1 Tax=Dioszegia hungarica TaxID=4972 RepID=A0AA38H6M1_9TREE|nr:Ima1 N-terminal domain-containing protein [Dioszegia hungarica]KAI9633529.1 Ima1 N-terminal domain-containing protein [Dioszegia hungarica]